MPRHHRTVDRITRILEEMVYRPGMTFAELARAVGAPKSSVHGFTGGLLARGWLYETDHHFYLGPAVYALTLASGETRAGSVTPAHLEALHEEAQAAVFLGVLTGDHLIYVSEAGSDPVAGFSARSNIRRTPLATAGGKALLAGRSDTERQAYLDRRPAEEAELVQRFLEELPAIQATGIAINFVQGGRRFGIATTLEDQSGEAVASVTLVGPTADLHARQEGLSEMLLRHVQSWPSASVQPREPI